MVIYKSFSCDFKSSIQLTSYLMEGFPPKMREKTRVFILTTFAQYCTKLLASAIRQEKKKVKDIQNGKEDVKLYLLTGDLIIYIEDPKETAKKITRTD